MPSFDIQKKFSQSIRRASRLTDIGMGKLLETTRLIQHALLGDVQRVKPQASDPAAPAANHRQVADPPVTDAPPPVIILPPPPKVSDDMDAPRKASFSQHQFVFEGDTYPYRLFVPSAINASDKQPMPLVVLLHGCKQDALDFSNGTAMNTLAQAQQVMVLYPEQITSANALRCWNWFEPDHQKAEHGEPGMIAALTQKIVLTQGADPQRVYIAGLSAGGAMAAVVSSLYPQVYAAVGVHSGLAAGAARDVMSAFSAMRSGARGHAPPAMPTIVFHGDDDKTVHPDNGQHIMEAALAALKTSGLKLVKSQDNNGRETYSADGKPYIENWRIDDGAHAWSGGDSAGSYTDPDGPSASAAMLAFFLQHRLQGV